MQIQLPRSLEFITVKNLGGEPKGEKLRDKNKQQIFADLKRQVDGGEPLLLEIVGGVCKTLFFDSVGGRYYIQTSSEQEGRVLGKTPIDPDVARAELHLCAAQMYALRTQRRRKKGKA